MAAQRLVRGAVADVANRIHIQLRGLPKTALPSDLHRLCSQAEIEHVKRVDIDYKRFEPRGVGWVTVASPEAMKQAVDGLNGTTMASFSITANSSPGPVLWARTRGVKGRAEAANRGIITGDGPGGGISGAGRCVVLIGLPGKMTAEGLKAWLKNFKLAGNTPDGKEIVKIELPPKQFTFYSRHLVRLSSVSEAHRLVRKLHHTYYEPDTFGTRYPLRARVIY